MNPRHIVVGTLVCFAAYHYMYQGEVQNVSSPHNIPSNVHTGSIPTIDTQIVSLSDYYKFALDQSKSNSEGSCIAFRLQNTETDTNRYMCIVRGENAYVKEKNNEKSPLTMAVMTTDELSTMNLSNVASTVSMDPALLKVPWQKLTDWTSLDRTQVQVSSYWGLGQFARHFNFGQTVWERYLKEAPVSSSDYADVKDTSSDHTNTPLSKIL